MALRQNALRAAGALVGSAPMHGDFNGSENELAGKMERIISLDLFLVPFFFSKTAIALGMPDFCISPGWKLFYDAAVGQSEGYGLTMSASLLLSPLIMLWQYSTSDAPEVYNRPKALLVAISGMVVFLGFVGALILGLPIESIETPGRGVWAMIILGQFHLVFSLGYGVFVAAGAVIGYSSCMIAWAALNRFIPDGAGG